MASTLSSLASVGRDLALTELSQLVHLRRLPGNRTLHHLDSSADHGPSTDSIGSRLRLNLDDADSGIILTSIMSAIAKIANPGLESRRVVLLHHVSITDDGGLAADRSPFACAVEEGHVDG
jgi:hypothetical protein